MSKNDPFTYARMFRCLREIVQRNDPDGTQLANLKADAPVDPATLAIFMRRMLMAGVQGNELVEWGGFGALSAKYQSTTNAWITFYHGTKRKGEVVGSTKGPTFCLNASDTEESLVVLASNALGVRLQDDAETMDDDPLFKELAEENAGIVAPTPVPLWKPSPNHPGTTLPKDWQHPNRPELKGWNWYPVVQHDVEPAHVIRISKRCWAHVEVCQQDGCWVEGIDYNMHYGGGCYSPGRTGGEHLSALHAELYGWECIQHNIGTHPKETREHRDSVKLVNAIQHRIRELRVKLKDEAAPAATVLQPQDEPVAAQQAAKATDRKRPAKAHKQLDAMEQELATGALLHMPSKARLPKGYVKAKDVMPGMFVYPLGRDEAHQVQSVELYGKSCSIMFADGSAGTVVNPLHPIKVGKPAGPVVAHVNMVANPSPKVVAALGELVEKAARYKPRKRKVGHQGGAVLEDGTLVADPTNALLELRDQANDLRVRVDVLPNGSVVPYTPASERVVRTTITELAAPFGRDRREREVVKKRFTTLLGKLRKLPAEQQAAFLQYANTILNP